MTPAEVDAAIKDIRNLTRCLRDWLDRPLNPIEGLINVLQPGGAGQSLLASRLALEGAAATFLNDLAGEGAGAIEKLAVASSAGNLAAEVILCTIAIRQVSHEPALGPTRNYISSILQSRLEALRTAPRRGRSYTTGTSIRDLFIFMHVSKLLSKFEDLQPTRSPSSKRDTVSACSIVRDALDHPGLFALSEKRVNEIWAAEAERNGWRPNTHDLPRMMPL